MALGVRGRALSDRDGTVVASDSEPLVVSADATRALGVWELGERGGTAAS